MTTELARFSVSMDRQLLEGFNRWVAEEGYPTRSKAVADLVSKALVEHEWTSGRSVAGAVIMVYDHHKHDLTTRLTHLQHDYHDVIVSSQHVHMDHDNCLETVVVRGAPSRVGELVRKLKGTKGVKHTSVATASTGQGL